MCGLAGLFLYPRSRPAEDWAELRELFTRNLTYNEERGREASGVAVIQRDGEYDVYKEPVTATELVQTPRYQEIMAAIGAETTCVLGHTRMPTKGSRWNNANNHPVVTEYTIGVHNGVLKNDDELFAELQLPRAGEVDSEIIFRLLDTVEPNHKHDELEIEVQREMSRLHGSFAILAVDIRSPGRLLVLKNFRPLCIHYEERFGALFFSSRYVFLRKAFGRSVITEALKSERGFCFDAERLLERGNEPLCTFPIAVRPVEQ